MSGNSIHSFAGKQVLIIGDVMLDTYLYGKAERISPEAPVPVVEIEKREERLGGAANVALNVKLLGAEPLVCSVIGKDIAGKNLLRLFKQYQMDTSGIIQDKKRKTTVKTRILSHNHQMLRFDEETDKLLPAAQVKTLLKQILQVLPQVHVVIFQDYDKGVITKEVISEVVKATAKWSIPVAVDPKKRHFLYYHHVTLFKPNLRELKQGLNLDFDDADDYDIRQAVKLLRKKMPHKITFVTLAARGILVENGKRTKIVPAHALDVVDVSGAGDTVISVAALGLAAGMDVFEIARIANVAAGIVCQQAGVVPVDKQSLEQALMDE